MTEYCYFTFPTTYFAIRAESILRHKEFKIRMVPVPRSISTSCGTALRCLPEDKEAIQLILQNNNVETEGSFLIKSK